MSENNDGGQAFPCKIVGSTGMLYNRPGMTLRDYFAAKAMAAMLSLEDVHLNYSESELAKWSYQHADAMLEQRMVPVDSANDSA